VLARIAFWCLAPFAVLAGIIAAELMLTMEWFDKHAD
jgi:hypothetical protein